jgi:hypothetical protein
MGLYDTFVLKVPIQCRNCYTGAFNDFQTKDLECSLDVYVEGEPAVGYGWRGITEDEKKERRERYMLFYPDMVGTVMEEMSGMFRTDKNRILHKLPDGVYCTYTWCKNCNSMMYVPMEVKGGIFVGVGDKC